MKFCDECHETEEHMSGCPNEVPDVQEQIAEEQSASQRQYDAFRTTAGMTFDEGIARMEQDAETLRRMVA